VVDIDRDSRIIGFQEKPQQTDLRSPYDSSKISASMGVYISIPTCSFLCSLKRRGRSAVDPDFGKNILPKMLRTTGVSFNFIGREPRKRRSTGGRGTLEAFYEANMDLVSVSPVFNLYDEHWADPDLSTPVSTCQVCLCGNRTHGQSARFVGVFGLHRLGWLGPELVLSPDVRVNSFRRVESSILFFARKRGRRCKIRRADSRPRCAHSRRTTIGYDA